MNISLSELSDLERRFDGPIPEELLAGGAWNHALSEARKAFHTSRDQLRKRVSAIEGMLAAIDAGDMDNYPKDELDAWIGRLIKDLDFTLKWHRECREHLHGMLAEQPQRVAAE